MRKHLFTTSAIGTLLMMFVLLPRTAQAYIDPGTGSILLQAIVGGVFAILLGIKMFWGKITGFLTGARKKESAEDHEQR